MADPHLHLSVGIANAQHINGPASAPASIPEHQVQPAKTVSMKLFASWEVEKSSSSCIPRLCMFNVTKLNLNIHQLDQEDIHGIILAVRSEGSKRVLRSGEIPLSALSSSDTAIDITFSMQYAHFLKRDFNNLVVMLQRRKKYKNRTFLGYKTLGLGTVNLSKVLQSPKDLELELKNSKDKHKVLAVVSLHSITSKPLAYDEGKNMSMSGTDRSPESDEEDEDNLDELSLEDSCGSDEEAQARAATRRDTTTSGQNGAEQSNFKTKFIKLLRRFKSSDDAEKQILKVLQREQEEEGATSAANFDELFDELESLSEDSDNEQDNISILSTPKPTLPTYFSKTSSLDTMKQASTGGSDRDSVTSTGLDGGDTPAAGSLSAPPHLEPPSFGASGADDVFNQELFSHDQPSSIDKQHYSNLMSKVYRDSSKELPEVIYLIDDRSRTTYYTVAHSLYQTLQRSGQPMAIRVSDKDAVKEFVKQTASAIQSFCNNNSRAPNPIKVILIGSDCFYNQFLEEFVKVFSERSPDWLNYLRIIPIPLGSSLLCKYLSSIELYFNQLFSSDSSWQKLIDRTMQSSFISGEGGEMIDRICKFGMAATTVLPYPISEAMVAFKGQGKDKSNTQMFIPFLTEVLIGNYSAPVASVSTTSTPLSIPGSSEQDDPLAVHSSSPAANKDIVMSSSYSEKFSSSLAAANKEAITPSIYSRRKSSVPLYRSRGSDGHVSPATGSTHTGTPSSAGVELCEIQLDYWLPNKSGDKSKSNVKETLKGYFKYVQITRERNTFSLTAVSREKKGKMIRIGKKSKDKTKEKEVDSKSSCIIKEGITRIVCTAKDSNDSLSVLIDKEEHSEVLFFQLSTQWQSHVKNLPIAVTKQCQSYEV